MRGADERTGAMFSYVSLEERVPLDHPLRGVRRITDRVARIEAGLLLIDVDFFSARKALTHSQLYTPFEMSLDRLPKTR